MNRNSHYCSLRMSSAHHNVLYTSKHGDSSLSYCEKVHLSTKIHLHIQQDSVTEESYINRRLEKQCPASCFLCKGADRERPVLPFTQQSFVGQPQTHGSNYNRPDSAKSLKRTSITPHFNIFYNGSYLAR